MKTLKIAMCTLVVGAWLSYGQEPQPSNGKKDVTEAAKPDEKALALKKALIGKWAVVDATDDIQVEFKADGSATSKAGDKIVECSWKILPGNVIHVTVHHVSKKIERHKVLSFTKDKIVVQDADHPSIKTVLKRIN